MKKLFYTIIALVLTTHSFAQPGWTVYSSSNTIFNSDIFTSIAIDQSGKIWCGSYYDGLYEYDGLNWTNFRTSNSNILSDAVTSLVIDNNNKVWVGNSHGVSVFYNAAWTNYDTNNASFNGYSVYTLGKNNNGDIWLASQNGSFGYEGISVFSGSSWTNLTNYPSQINGAEFSDFAFASNNDAWLACNNGVAKYTSSGFTYYPPVSTLSMSQQAAIDANGNVWMGGFHALVKYDGSTWTSYDNTTDLGLISNTLYYDIFPDGNYLWIGCSEGLIKFDRINATVVANYKSTNSPLGDNCVGGIAKDASGMLWLSTNIGIVKMDPAVVGIDEAKEAYQFNVFPNPAKDMLTIDCTDFTNTVVELFDAQGRLLMSEELHSAKSRIDISHFAAGVVYAKIRGEKGISVKKFLKE